MKPEIKELWLKALRSGEYTQHQTALRGTEDGTTGYCCLGVLCDVYLTETGQGVWVGPTFIVNDNPIFRPDDESSTELPRSVMEWAGLNSTDPTVPFVDDTHEGADKGFVYLAALNDSDVPFVQIADIIEHFE